MIVDNNCRIRLTLAIRTLKRQRIQVCFAVVSLVVAYLALLTIGARLVYEFRYDHWGSDSNRVMRVNLVHDGNQVQPVTPGAVAIALKSKVPAIEESGRILTAFSSETVEVDGKTFLASTASIDAEILDIFEIPLIISTDSLALQNPYQVILSSSMANQLFGHKALHECDLRIYSDADWAVAGVFPDVKNPTHLRKIDVFSSMMKGIEDTDWNSDYYNTYVRLSPGGQPEELNAALDSLLKNMAPHRYNSARKWRLRLQPIQSIHFIPSEPNRLSASFNEGAGRVNVFVLGITLLIILLLAIFNFVGLYVGKFEHRKKQIIIAKLYGASSWNLISQFLIESGIINVGALLLSLVIFAIRYEPIVRWIGLESWGVLGSHGTRVVAFGVCGYFILAVASVIPLALYLQSFSPQRALLAAGIFPVWDRYWNRVLLVFQFSLVICLLIFGIGMNRQIRFIAKQPLGFDHKNLLCLRLHRPFSEQEIERLAHDIEQLNEVQETTHAKESIPQHLLSHQTVVSPIQPEKPLQISSTTVAPNFPNAMGIHLLGGRWFYPTEKTKRDHTWIINSKAAKQLGIAPEELPARVAYANSSDQIMSVVGIVEDFHFESLHVGIAPLIYFAAADRSKYFYIRYKQSELYDLIDELKYLWKINDYDAPLDPVMVNDQVEYLYSQENRIYNIVGGLVIIAVILSVLGLISYSQSVLNRKERELMIRKVHGAESVDLVHYLLGYLLRWIVVSEIIAFPIALLIYNKWLEQLVYRTQLNPWIIIFTMSLIILLSAGICISQIMHVVRSSPAYILRQD